VEERRLARVESKIDDLQKAVVTLARVEERIQTIFNRQSSIEQRVNRIDEAVQNLSPSVRFAERLFWILLVAFSALLSTFL